MMAGKNRRWFTGTKNHQSTSGRGSRESMRRLEKDHGEDVDALFLGGMGSHMNSGGMQGWSVKPGGFTLSL